ncbi:protein of unknown function [Cupriavidus taiwanensis]|nr:protein of unknown function [Cupriavidus taiwanensis]
MEAVKYDSGKNVAGVGGNDVNCIGCEPGHPIDNFERDFRIRLGQVQACLARFHTDAGRYHDDICVAGVFVFTSVEAIVPPERRGMGQVVPSRSAHSREL